MPRLTKEQIDEEILEAAAALFARHGVEQTSVQRIADAVGYSKTGLLHRFPTKEALEEATITHTLAAVEAIATDVGALPPGLERDRAVLNLLLDACGDHPGLVAFMLTGITQGSVPVERLDAVGAGIFASFGLEPPGAGPVTDPAVLRSCVRVTSAVCGLVMTSLAFTDVETETLRTDLVETALAALGHATTSTPPHPEEF